MIKKITEVVELLLAVIIAVTGRKGAKVVHEALCEAIAAALELLEPAARLGTRLHNAIWTQTPMVALEVVTFSLVLGVPGKLCVWLSRRKDGEAYAGLLHSPGTLGRGSDESVAAAVNRLAVREFGFEPGSKALHVLGLRKGLIRPETIQYDKEERGMMFSLLFPARAIANPTGDGAWYLVADVAAMTDDEIIPDHRDRLVPVAAERFDNWNGYEDLGEIMDYEAFPLPE